VGNHSEPAMKQLIKYTPHMRLSTRLRNSHSSNSIPI